MNVWKNMQKWHTLCLFLYGLCPYMDKASFKDFSVGDVTRLTDARDTLNLKREW